jgi:hypothetical protein
MMALVSAVIPVILVTVVLGVVLGFIPGLRSFKVTPYGIFQAKLVIYFFALDLKNKPNFRSSI